MGDFVNGVITVLRLVGSPMLYRYPYRTSAEGLHADWQKISQDIELAIGRLDSGGRHE